MKLLIFPCGSEIGIEIYNSLYYKKEIQLIGGSSVDDYGKIIFENFVHIPYITDSSFDEELKKIIIENGVDFIIPTNEISLLKINQIQDLQNKIISHPIETIKICAEKKITYQKLKDHIKVPQIYSIDEIKKYPVFSKPNIGHSGINCFKINNKDDLIYVQQKYPDNLFVEYLPGSEYTIDCFTDFESNLIFISPRKRNRIINGISASTVRINDPRFNEIAQKINSVLKFNGAWFFQVKEDINGELTLLEIASRIAGSSSINKFYGINLSELNLLNHQKIKLNLIDQKIDLQYDRHLNVKVKINISKINKIFIDLDDTLIRNKKVDSDIIKNIYDFKNLEKKIILITKHSKNPLDTLGEFYIDKNIFSEIIHLRKTDKKSSFLSHNSILIDDSFSERLDAYQKKNVIVFSNESIRSVIWE